MSEHVLGRVINLHALGATVRLESGELAAASQADVEARRPAYAKAHQSRATVPFQRLGRAVTLVEPTADERVAAAAHAPASLVDDRLEARIADYLRQTEEWAPPDRPEPAERHLFRKRQRARQFEPPDPGAA